MKATREEVVRLVEKAIAEEDYGYIYMAECLAHSAGIEMSFDEKWVMVGDEVFYFNGAF